MSTLIGKKLGHFEVVEQIGQGGMATVYKAYQPALDRHVAIKVLPDTYAKDRTFSARFVREARAIAKLYHPHILPIHDFGEQDDTTYIVMEYVSGGTFKKKLKPGQGMALREAIDLILQACQALECAHQNNIVHRDVKPGNMLLRSDSFLLLADFGIAKILEATTMLTRTGVGIGTPQYMSPEQGTGGAVDGRSDIYSLGIVLYQAVTGRVPFGAPGDAPLTISLKHVNDPLPPPRQFVSDLPPMVEHVIVKALEKDPNRRFQTATEMIEALSNINLALRGPTIGFSSAFSALPSLPDHQGPSMQEMGAYPLPPTPLQPVGPQQGTGCFRCGNENLPGKLFCTTCGYDLSGRRAQSDRYVNPQTGRPYYAHFAMLNGPLTGRHYTLHQDTTTIGRTTGNDIIIPDLTVSRRHAVLRFENGHWLVEDKGSANGTFVNDMRIRWPQVVKEGDRIRFGDEIVAFSIVQ